MYHELPMKAVYLFFLLFTPVLLAQQVESISKTPLKADEFIGIDAFENIYFTTNMELHKAGLEGDFVFNDLQLGPITSVDIINPLNVVLFYEDTNTVVLLDNKLYSQYKTVGLALFINYLNSYSLAHLSLYQLSYLIYSREILSSGL